MPIQSAHELPDPNYDYEYDAALQRMEKTGGSFVRALAAAYRAADPGNKQKIRTTWPDYWAAYAYLAGRDQGRLDME